MMLIPVFQRPLLAINLFFITLGLQLHFITVMVFRWLSSVYLLNLQSIWIFLKSKYNSLCNNNKF